MKKKRLTWLKRKYTSVIHLSMYREMESRTQLSKNTASLKLKSYSMKNWQSGFNVIFYNENKIHNKLATMMTYLFFAQSIWYLEKKITKQLANINMANPSPILLKTWYELVIYLAKSTDNRYIHPTKYTHNFSFVFWHQSTLPISFTDIQDYFTGTGAIIWAIIWLPQCQLGNPKENRLICTSPESGTLNNNVTKTKWTTELCTWLFYIFYNSLAPGRCDSNFKSVIFKPIIQNSNSRDCLIALRWMPQNPINEKSTLIQVMDWCGQATNHYLSQSWSNLCCHMASLGHNELKGYTIVIRMAYPTTRWPRVSKTAYWGNWILAKFQLNRNYKLSIEKYLNL